MPCKYDDCRIVFVVCMVICSYGAVSSVAEPEHTDIEILHPLEILHPDADMGELHFRQFGHIAILGS